jgi:peptidoglycan hydrolase-like protein with peptidoglycan-binding domain
MATRHGSRAVRRLQRDLRQLGYRPGPVDGRYGPRTRGAVAWFQLKHGLDRTGAATARTLAHMRDRLRPTAATAAPADIIRPAAQSAQPVQPGTGPISLPSAGRGLSEVAVEIVLIALTGLGLGVIVGTYAQTRIRLGRPSRITGRLGNGVRS